jgi:hypothetical protein
LAPALCFAFALLMLGAPRAGGRAGLPPIVFVSRQPIGHGLVPGLGPHQRAQSAGGRLLIRDADGAIRELAKGAFFDFADPAVSPDGKRLAFAATAHRDSGFRIWRLNLDGTGLAQVTRSRDTLLDSLGRVRKLTRYDDLDPIWISDHQLCFSSTRLPQRNLYDGAAAANLYVVNDDGGALARVTADRNGAEEPALDSKGRLVYARWWFNPWRAGSTGAQREPAVAMRADSVNLWQIVMLGADGVKLAAGPPSPGARGHVMGHEPCPMPDGKLAATYALNFGLSPAPGATGVHVFRRLDQIAERLAGPIQPERPGDPYSAARGLAAPVACAPAALDGSRLIVAYDPGGHGDYGLALMRPGKPPEMLLNLPATMELDPAPVVTRRLAAASLPRGVAPDDEAALLRGRGPTFTFESSDVFAGSGMANPSGSPVIRFYEERAGDDRGDSLLLIREVPIGADGRVRVTDLPAWTPMFEEIALPGGPALMGSHGPAHVAGFNFGPAGATVSCTGCHAGHSMMKPSKRR